MKKYKKRPRRAMVCKYCKKEFNVYPYEIRKGRQYCCVSCKHMDGSVERTCKYCRKVFRMIKSNLKREYGVYCSKTCYSKAMVHGKWMSCMVCGKKRWIIKTILDKGWGNYCGKRHYGEARRNSGLYYNGVTKLAERIRRLVEYKEWH
jgi:hypothetical protein